MRELILAVQFLTRLPTPAAARLRPGLAGRLRPLVCPGGRADWRAALAALAAVGPSGALAGGGADLAAVGVLTGALHLDGLADLADGLARRTATRRASGGAERPACRQFWRGGAGDGLVAQAGGLMLAARHGLSPWRCCCCRRGALWRAVVVGQLPPLASGGQAERFAWKSGPALLWLTLLGLLAISAWLTPWL